MQKRSGPPATVWGSKVAAVLALICGLAATTPGFSTDSLKDAADKALDAGGKPANILTPGPAGAGLNISREYQGYVPEIAFFPSAPPPPPSPFKVKMAKKKGLKLKPEPPQTVFGRLYRPEGEGPFPAVVLLHGSWGIWQWNDIWALRLRDWGYVVLDVDSLSPRGLYRHNTGFGDMANGEPRRMIGAFVRTQDAHGARAYLSRRPEVDAARIGVLGMSQGGQTAMHAVANEGNPNLEGGFQAAVALYPSCNIFSGFKAPLLVLIGTDDEWVGHKYCQENLAKAVDGAEVSLKVYDGAAHGFDFEGKERRFFGLPLRHDKTATADAVDRIRAFLAVYLQ